MQTTTEVIVDRSKKRQIIYTIYPDQATVRDRWQIEGQKFVHAWSCDCGQTGCRHIILAKAKAFEKRVPAPVVEEDELPARRLARPPDESIIPRQQFRPFIED